MSKARFFAFRFSVILFCILGLYYELVHIQVFHLSQNNVLLNIGALAFIFLLGLIIISPGLNRSPENFVMRFLILTTVQMLSVLSMILALVYTEFEDARNMGFHLIGVFCLLLAIQSVLLIRINLKRTVN